MSFIILSATLVCLLILLAISGRCYVWQRRHHQRQLQYGQQLAELGEQLQQLTQSRHDFMQFWQQQQQQQHGQRTQFDQYRIDSLKSLQQSLQQASELLQQQLNAQLSQHAKILTNSINTLTQQVQQQLEMIAGQVDRRLNEGFAKTQTTFTQVIERLKMIDAAQKRLHELSNNVVSLQEVLADKRSRGAFGEVQLSALLRNVLPERHFSLQHQLSNKRLVDCLLFLPQPTGNVAIDAKFPLESYQRLVNSDNDIHQKTALRRQFQIDIRKHIQDIAEKYIIPGETADGAMMFIPAESIFAEIHAHHPELVQIAHKARVWLVSPTTLMAVLTTARAVIKDTATRQQVHIMQKHLSALSEDFNRFRQRMEKLARHINQAQQDVSDVHKSSQRISARFTRIEQVELATDDNAEVASVEPPQ